MTEIKLSSPDISDTCSFALTAYKSGGFSNGSFNSALSNDNLGDITFGKEKARGFEFGLKSELFDRQLRFNMTGYFYKYSGLQLDFFSSPIFAFVTLSVDARAKGIETEFEFAPIAAPGLNVHGPLNYNKVRYTDFPDAPCYSGQTPAQGCNLNLDTLNQLYRPITDGEIGQLQDMAGAATSMAPDWTATLGASFETDMSSKQSISIGIDARYSTATFHRVSARNCPGSAPMSRWTERSDCVRATAGSLQCWATT